MSNINSGILGGFGTLGPFAAASSPTYAINSGIAQPSIGGVQPDGTIRLIQGDSYSLADGTAVSFTNNSWQLTTAQAVTFSLSDVAGQTVYLNSIPATVIDDTTFAVELSSAQTASIPITTRVGKILGKFSIEMTTSSGGTTTLLTGRATIVTRA